MVQTTLNARTIFVTLFPNFNMSLKDPHLYDALHIAAGKIHLWPSTRRHVPVKVSANYSTRITRHQHRSHLVVADTIRIVFLRSASSEKNRLHLTAHAPSHTALSFGEFYPCTPRAVGLPANVITDIITATSTLADTIHWLFFDGWLWLGLTIDFFHRVDFLRSKCSLPSFLRRFHFCSLFLHILLLNEE